jgi:hypothetical protein
MAATELRREVRSALARLQGAVARPLSSAGPVPEAPLAEPKVGSSSFATEQSARLLAHVRVALPVDDWDAVAARLGGSALRASLRGLQGQPSNPRSPTPTQTELPMGRCGAGTALPVGVILGHVGEGLAALSAATPVPGAPGDPSADDATAVLLAHAAVALYASVFDTLLTAVLPIQAYREHWARLLRDPFATAYDLVASTARRETGHQSVELPSWQAERQSVCVCVYVCVCVCACVCWVWAAC